MIEGIWCPICETSDMLDTHYKYASDGIPFWECNRCGTQFDHDIFNRIKNWKEKAADHDEIITTLFDVKCRVEDEPPLAFSDSLWLHAYEAWRKEILDLLQEQFALSGER